MYDSMERFSEANKPLFVECVEKRRAELGKNHPDTLRSMNYLAAVYYSMERYSEAEPLFEKCVEKSRAVLGENHPDTLASKYEQ
jgi:hypothetical protein